MGAWGVRRELRPSPALGALMLGALLVRTLWIPVHRHEYDGHEAAYLEIWMGERALSQGGTLMSPTLQWLYRGLGLLLPFSWGPVALSLLASLVGLGAVGGVLERRLGPRAALWGVAALALWGNHAAWSSSAYNVILPFSLAALSFWGLTVGGGWGGALAGGAAALAVGMRVETALLAPFGLALIRDRRALPGVGVGALIGAGLAGLMLLPGHPPGSGQRSLSFAQNWWGLEVWAPFDRWWTWPSLVVGAWRLGRTRLGAALWALGLILWLQLAGASFDDFASRHVLTGGLAIAALLGSAGPWALPAFLALTVDLHDVSRRFYAPEERYEATLAGLPSLPPSTLERCALICEDSRIVPEGTQRSHFNLLDPAEAEGIRGEKGCVYWLRGTQDWRWSSRGVRDRALRLERLYPLTVLGVVKDSSRGYVVEVVEVGARAAP